MSLLIPPGELWIILTFESPCFAWIYQSVHAVCSINMYTAGNGWLTSPGRAFGECGRRNFLTLVMFTPVLIDGYTLVLIPNKDKVGTTIPWIPAAEFSVYIAAYIEFRVSFSLLRLALINCRRGEFQLADPRKCMLSFWIKFKFFQQYTESFRLSR